MTPIPFTSDPTISSDGTYCVDEIVAQYSALVAVFGPPGPSDAYKSDAEWVIRFEPDASSPVIATIYNWKDGPNYLGEDGTPPHLITNWHIGGYTINASHYVSAALLTHFLINPTTPKKETK